MGARKLLKGIANIVDTAGMGLLCVEEPERVQVVTYMHPAMNALGGI